MQKRYWIDGSLDSMSLLCTFGLFFLRAKEGLIGLRVLF